jgi:hypothetical protein
MFNDIEVQALALDPIIVPVADTFDYIEYHNFNNNMVEQYQDLLNMGFTPVDETGDMTPTAVYVEPQFVMDIQTIFYEFEQLHNGVGNQILREFLDLNGSVVLISKYNEVYVFRQQNMVQNG